MALWAVIAPDCACDLRARIVRLVRLLVRDRSAIVGAALSGVVAVGAAFLAAWLARRHDRLQQDHQAVARLSIVVYDVAEALGDFRRADYADFARHRVRALRRAVILEAPYLTESELLVQVYASIAWMEDVWVPALEEMLDEADRSAMDPELRLLNIQSLALGGATVMGDLNLALGVWQASEHVSDVVSFPDLDGARDPS
jgi:hypothetical protein